MLILPIETEGHTGDMLIVVLAPDNLERMKKADPAEVKMAELGKNLVNPVITICYEHDQKKLMQLVNVGDIRAVLKYLNRGWKFQPDKGDHDRGPERISRSN